MSKDNNSESPLYLCKSNNNKCKQLIEMIEAIVLDKLLKDRSYINENNEIAESVINNKIDDLTDKLIKTPYSKNKYKNVEQDKINEIIKEENDLMANMFNNGMYPTTGQGPGNGSVEGSVSGVMDMATQHMNMKHLPRIGGNRIKSNKKTRKINKTYKKSKKIRKI